MGPLSETSNDAERGAPAPSVTRHPDAVWRTSSGVRMARGARPAPCIMSLPEGFESRTVALALRSAAMRMRRSGSRDGIDGRSSYTGAGGGVGATGAGAGRTATGPGGGGNGRRVTVGSGRTVSCAQPWITSDAPRDAHTAADAMSETIRENVRCAAMPSLDRPDPASCGIFSCPAGGQPEGRLRAGTAQHRISRVRAATGPCR